MQGAFRVKNVRGSHCRSALFRPYGCIHDMPEQEGPEVSVQRMRTLGCRKGRWGVNPVADDGSGIQDGPSCKQRVNTVQTIDTLCRQLFRDDSELEKVYLTLLFGVRADYPGVVELGDDCDEALDLCKKGELPISDKEINRPAGKALLNSIRGLSPILAGQLCIRADIDDRKAVSLHIRLLIPDNFKFFHFRRIY